MSAKNLAMIAVFALMITAFAGVTMCVNDSEAVEEDPVAESVSYIVGDKTYNVKLTEDEKTAKAVTLQTLEKLGAKADAGMEFVAWTCDGKTYAAGSTFIVGSAVPELTAKFQAVTYTATFLAEDGKTTIDIVDGKIKTDGGEEAIPVKLSTVAPSGDKVAVDGKIFAGWMTEGAEKAIATADLGDLIADVTYTATYVTDFDVIFIDGDKTYYSSVSELTVPDLGDRTGFTFLGWYVGATQIGIAQEDFEDYVFIEDTTFTAKWEPVNVYVTFAAGSFSTEVAVLYGQTVVEPALPSGYVGWGIEAEDGTVTAFDFSTAITEDMTIVGIAAAPAKATGLSDPIVMTLAIILGTLVLVGIAGLVVLKRQGKIVIGRGPNAAKNLPQEEKKE